jgi:mannose-6-phosphate isomerase-like protein (cupin superfamily)
VKVGDVFASPRSGAMLEVRVLPDRASAKLTIERLLRPGMGFVVPHVHAEFDETFEVVDGVADAWIGRRRIRLGQGETFRIPRGDVHVNPCNRSQRDLRFRQTYDPATRGAEHYVKALGRYLADGRDVRGDLSPLAAIALETGYDPETFAPALPRSLQKRVVFPAVRSLERWREDRRLIAERTRAAAAASEYGFWAEDREFRNRRQNKRSRLNG